MMQISVMAAVKWENCLMLLGNVSYRGEAFKQVLGRWLKFGWLEGKRKARKSLCLQDSAHMPRIIVFSLSFSCAAFQGRALHVFWFWFLSTVELLAYCLGGALQSGSPVDSSEAFMLWKKLSWFAIVNETCPTQCPSLRPTANMTVDLLSSPHGGTTWRIRAAETPQLCCSPGVSNCLELSFVIFS